MGFFGFLGRHLGAAIVGAVGLMLLALGYADQAQDIWSAAQPWQLQAGGAFLFVVAVIKVLYAFDKEQGARAGNAPPISLSPLPQPAPIGAPKAKAAPEQSQTLQPTDKEGRVYVEDHLTPEKLNAMCEGKTTHQARRAVEPFIGKWIRVTGVVSDFVMISDDLGIVRFEREVKSVIGEYRVHARNDIKLRFQSQLTRLEMLQGGEHLVVDGEIMEIDNFTLTLTKCEIVSVSDTPRA